MCTTDCRCYEGANGDVKKTWEGYGEETLNLYFRTTKEKVFKGTDGKYYYPLKWTSEKSDSTATFQECYDKKLSINDFDKYGTKELMTIKGKIPNKDRPTEAI